MVPILTTPVARLTQMSFTSRPSGSPSSNGVQAPAGGVAPAAGVITPRNTPTSLIAKTPFGSFGSRTAPVMATDGSADEPVPSIGSQFAPVLIVKKTPLLVAAMARAGFAGSTSMELTQTPPGIP